MKLPEEVTIRIRPDGIVEVETHGVTGSACTDISGYLERLLTGGGGDDDVERDLKAEYYLPDVEQAELEERAG